MAHYFSSSPCFLTFLIICYFFTSCTAWHTKTLLHHDGHASRNGRNHVFHKEKVSQRPYSDAATATNQANAGENTMVKMIHNAKGLKHSNVRKLLRNKQDMDEFVAYADYKGPMHHPPRNN